MRSVAKNARNYQAHGVWDSSLQFNYNVLAGYGTGGWLAGFA